MSLTLMVLSLVASSLAQEIKTDYDRNADFGRAEPKVTRRIFSFSCFPLSD